MIGSKLTMKYELKKANEKDISMLIDYKLQNIFEYAEKLSREETDRIHDYVRNHVTVQLDNYKIIYIDNNKVGCLLVENKDDGVLLDEIYLNENYRNRGIGTDIIKKVIKKNSIVYLWVYKLNVKAVSLYIKLGFKIIEETETRYYMKYSRIDRK